jgi:hypothetical protein
MRVSDKGLQLRTISGWKNVFAKRKRTIRDDMRSIDAVIALTILSMAGIIALLKEFLK